MTEAAVKTYADLVLPPNVVSRVDVSRILTELEQIDNDLTAITVRAGVGVQSQTMPTLSGPLNDFLVQNKLTLKTNKERSEAIKLVRALKDKVPVIHMTFAVTADPESLGKLAQWLRTSVHPQAVISVGLQPALVAGVYLRTPNHVHDMSLRAALKGGHDLLVKELGALRGKS
jgi:hypothetical protein